LGINKISTLEKVYRILRFNSQKGFFQSFWLLGMGYLGVPSKKGFPKIGSLEGVAGV